MPDGKWVSKANLQTFWQMVKSNLAAFVREDVNNVLPTIVPEELSKVLPTMVGEQIDNKFGDDIGDNVTAWLTEHVTPSGSAVVVDDTLTIAGAAADAKKTGDEISGLKEDFNTLAEDGTYRTAVKLVLTDYEQGGYSPTGIKESATYRVRTGSSYPIYKGDTITVTVESGYKVAVNVFDGVLDGNPRTRIYTSNWKTSDFSYTATQDGYAAVLLARAADGAVSVQEAISNTSVTMPMSIKAHSEQSVDDKFLWGDASTYFRSKFVTHMTHNGDGTYSPASFRNALIHPLHFDFDILITVDNGYKFSVQKFDGYETGTTHLVEATSQITTYYKIPANTYFCMIVGNSDDSKTDDTTQNCLEFECYTNIDDIYSRLMPLVDDVDDEPKDYVIGTGFTKTPISLKKLGKIEGWQSFCRYNGKYYSTNGSYIKEQDSSFNLLSTTSLSLGHGNSMQLGSNGIAYVSGWDDNKVYAVNLTSKTIVNTITLPTEGYTTCVVDDVNGIIYIFYRTSYPHTKDNYTFIVYDYVNESVISTKKINRAIGGMQACDYVDGVIFVTYGLASNTVPNGYILLNTNGDIIGEYILGSMTIEPEGICVDRETRDVYFSFIDEYVYTVQQNY